MSIRLTYLLGFILVAVILMTSIYLQVFSGIQPCPLCSLQRITFCLLGAVFLIGVLLSTKIWGRILTNLFIFLFSALGIFLAGRQVWVQNFSTPGTEECGVSLQYMAQVLPWKELARKVLLENSSECSKRGWEFLHLNMAEWSLVCFVLFLLMSLYLFLKEFKHMNYHHKHHDY